MDIYTFLEDLIKEHGYPGLFVVAYSESVIQPVPPDIFIVGASIFGLDPLICAVVSTIGSTLGGITGYILGHKLGTPVFIRLFGERYFVMGKEFFEKYGVWGVVIAGFTPLPYKVIAWLSGIFNMSILKFTLGTLIGRFPRFLLIAYFGHGISIYFTI
ncbi:MAG TPA: DedA family protein [Methanothermococcus okinawensis]|uniref:DedA family protein n=1 Tax=Methanothermococcus okinawensis TaxID=155863 RepID=A0A832ZCB0_9EURY|nr:DedA family protein [Methanococcaceae archaeon]HIP84309.1 DedA family protein [Methanothermococcus okinawensis]HIP91594.1 DedA family protein [Methanothermococcus okinawensis]